MSQEPRPVHYQEYLQLDKVLNAQECLSDKHGHPAHDELLFIVVHQTYELWFKQVLHEVDSVLDLFMKPQIDETQMGRVVSHLNRVVEIFKLLIEQVRVLETMTPMDFLEFRHLLFPASGFQSFQFRLLENKLGLRAEHRLLYNQAPYHAHLPQQQAKAIQEVEQQQSLFDCLDRWLARTPFLTLKGFDFWRSYRQAVEDLQNQDLKTIMSNPLLSQDAKEKNRKTIEQSRALFESLFDEKAYEQAKTQGTWRLSYKALQAALLIQLYREQPVLQLPFRLITALLDLDELMTTWRYRHAQMAKRMLGTKIGTGGSSGSKYLEQAADKHKIFDDLFQLTTFFIPRSALPELPDEVQRRLGFYYTTDSPS